jgi:hypothetical protein
MSTVPAIGSHVQISAYDFETGQTTYNAPAMTQAQHWQVAISQAAEAARKRFPHSNDRIERAYELVHAGKVVLHPQTRTATVTSSDGTKAYTVNGTCECPDVMRAPESFCKHALAVAILKKATALVREFQRATAPVVVHPEAMDPEAVEAETIPVTMPVQTMPQMPACPEFAAAVAQAEVEPDAPRIPREFLYDRKGVTAIRWGGLLHMAHEAGLYSLKVDVVTVTADFALMRATAKFNDGGEWSDIGDATPANVGREIAPAFIRMASTRAMARVLRVALDIHFVCSCELDGD